MAPRKSDGVKAAAKKSDTKYGGWLVKQLKDELKNRGLPVSGLKDALIERLEANDNEVEANGGVQVAKAEVDRRMTFVVNEQNRRRTFTLDKPKKGPRAAKAATPMTDLIEAEVEQPRKHSDSSTLVEIAQPPPIIEEEDEDIVFKPLNQTHPVVKTRKDSQEDDDGSELGSHAVDEEAATKEAIDDESNVGGTDAEATFDGKGETSEEAAKSHSIGSGGESEDSEAKDENKTQDASDADKIADKTNAGGAVAEETFDGKGASSGEAAASLSGGSEGGSEDGRSSVGDEKDVDDETQDSDSSASVDLMDHRKNEGSSGEEQHTYLMRGPGGQAEEIHASSLDQLIEKMKDCLMSSIPNHSMDDKEAADDPGYLAENCPRCTPSTCCHCGERNRKRGVAGCEGGECVFTEWCSQCRTGKHSSLGPEDTIRAEMEADSCGDCTERSCCHCGEGERRPRLVCQDGGCLASGYEAVCIFCRSWKK